MNRQRWYQIVVAHPIDLPTLAIDGPLTVMPGADPTQFRVLADQSGLIGFLRLLHNRGISLEELSVLDSAACSPQPAADVPDTA